MQYLGVIVLPRKLLRVANDILRRQQREEVEVKY
jgi:hypothetical protein